MDRVLFESEKRITQGYSNSHLGVDLGKSFVEEENMIFAHSAGVVVELVDGQDLARGSKGLTSYGNYILIDHGNGFMTRYAHLKKGTLCVSLGSRVYKDTPLGIMGESGNTYGRHLHFEVLKNKQRINPIPYLEKDLGNVHFYQVYDMVKRKWLPKVSMGTNDYAGNFGNAISGLLVENVTYRAHDKVKNKWLPYVQGFSSYAGNLENAIDGIQIKDVFYRVHLKNGNWLPWISKVDDTNSGYGGIFGHEIDAIQIKSKND